jgi:hypothetical protein
LNPVGLTKWEKALGMCQKAVEVKLVWILLSNGEELLSSILGAYNVSFLSSILGAYNVS